jgi:hypothetical protein
MRETDEPTGRMQPAYCNTEPWWSSRPRCLASCHALALAAMLLHQQQLHLPGSTATEVMVAGAGAWMEAAYTAVERIHQRSLQRQQLYDRVVGAHLQQQHLDKTSQALMS